MGHDLSCQKAACSCFFFLTASCCSVRHRGIGGQGYPSGSCQPLLSFSVLCVGLQGSKLSPAWSPSGNGPSLKVLSPKLVAVNAKG